MNPYDVIAEYCQTTPGPVVYYLAIGCANPHKNSPQQLPPQVAALPGRKICILVDPELESPPMIYKQIGISDPTDSPCVEFGDLTFFPVRARWQWDGVNELALLETLHTKAVYGTARMVVQDYTGRNIHRYYPLDRYPVQRLTQRVLYDITGNGGGCFVDFGAEHIYTDSRDNFMQIPYTPLWLLNTVASPAVVAKEAQHRQTTIMNYVHRLWRIQKGQEEERYWCTPDTVHGAAAQLFAAYNIVAYTDPETLIILMHDVATDMALTAGVDLDAGDLRMVITAQSYRGEPVYRGEPLDALLSSLRSKIHEPQ